MKEHIAHSGAWGIALIVIVVASWFLYRYLAPKTWKEWGGRRRDPSLHHCPLCGDVRVSLYHLLLVRFFGIDRTYLNANLWSTLLGYGETGMMISMILGYLIAFAGLGIFIEGWRELHRARQENRLVTDRLYGLVRHPQYTGLFIALFGEGIVHWPTIFSIGLFPIIILAYVLLARSEERKMLDHFGEEYRAYRLRVPGFIPRWGQWRNVISMRSGAPESDQTPG